MRHLLSACLLLLCSLALPSLSQAAECTEITNPYTQLGASGHYCLGANLAVTTTSMNVISITANDVDFDCRGYSIVNNSTDPTSDAVGVHIYNHRNVHVRNCHIQGGFMAGIYAYQDNGQANLNRNLSFAGNTISGTTWFGILAYGTDIEIRDNLIYDVGGRASFAMGIRVGSSILAGQRRSFMVRDNVIRSVASPVNYGYGIYANNANASTFTGNTITDTRGDATWFGYGIKIAQGGNNMLLRNQIIGYGDGYAVGIFAPATDACYENHIRADYKTLSCDASLGNY